MKVLATAVSCAWSASSSRPIVGSATLAMPRFMLAAMAPRMSALSTSPLRAGLLPSGTAATAMALLTQGIMTGLGVMAPQMRILKRPGPEHLELSSVPVTWCGGPQSSGGARTSRMAPGGGRVISGVQLQQPQRGHRGARDGSRSGLPHQVPMTGDGLGLTATSYAMTEQPHAVDRRRLAGSADRVAGRRSGAIDAYLADLLST